MTTFGKSHAQRNFQKSEQASFDAFASDYETALQQGLSVSGEGKDFFAEQRLLWLSKRLERLRHSANTVLDFGCGTGSSTPFFWQFLDVKQVIGVDVSAESLKVARRIHDPERSRFATLSEFAPAGDLNLAFCNGVFHHIPLESREESVNYIFRSLTSGGLFAFWENNPWNPGTRYVMSKIPFDRDAITLTPPEARTLLKQGGFEILTTDFLFIFPRSLRVLRWMEPPLSALPLGAQYMVLCRKP